MCACVWDEFLEFLPENRVPTSADFNTYPIPIFLSTFSAIPIMNTNYNYYIYETYGVPTNSEKFGQNRLKHIL